MVGYAHAHKRARNDSRAGADCGVTEGGHDRTYREERAYTRDRETRHPDQPSQRSRRYSASDCAGRGPFRSSRRCLGSSELLFFYLVGNQDRNIFRTNPSFSQPINDLFRLSSRLCDAYESAIHKAIHKVLSTGGLFLMLSLMAVVLPAPLISEETA